MLLPSSTLAARLSASRPGTGGSFVGRLAPNGTIVFTAKDTGASVATSSQTSAQGPAPTGPSEADAIASEFAGNNAPGPGAANSVPSGSSATTIAPVATDFPWLLVAIGVGVAWFVFSSGGGAAT